MVVGSSLGPATIRGRIHVSFIQYGIGNLRDSYLRLDPVPMSGNLYLPVMSVKSDPPIEYPRRSGHYYRCLQRAAGSQWIFHLHSHGRRELQ